MAKQTGAKRHTHKYHLLNGVWTCALPDCTHFMPTNVGSPIGKLSICWSCANEIVLDEDNMKMDRPSCMQCQGIATFDLEKFLANKGL